MSCTTSEVLSPHPIEAAEFAREFRRQTFSFIQAIQLPSHSDPSVLAYKSKSGVYYVTELEDSYKVRCSIQDDVEDAIRGMTITVDTTAIVDDIVNAINSFIGGAKVTPTFRGLSTTTYRGTVCERDITVKIILAVYIADASRLYDSEAGSVLELAYHAFLTAQTAE